MVLWVDKYRPKDLSSLDYHLEQAKNLKKLTQHGDFPHLLIYGPQGAGKKTRIMCLLKELYGNGVERLRMEEMQFTTPSNKKVDVKTISSNYHIEINPSQAGIYDRIVIMELIKNVAQNQQLDATGQREFKVIVLVDVDELTKDAQHALRRTMEKYVANCRLILCCTSISRVTPAIRSRCLSIRVSAPSKETIVNILNNVAKKESINLPEELAERIATSSDQNLRRALLLLEASKAKKYPFAPDQALPEPQWLLYIREMAKKILEEQSVQRLTEVRNCLYELITHAIPSKMIMKVLLDELLKKCDTDMKMQVIEAAGYYEHRMLIGQKEIFHFEAFVAKFMYLYKKYLEDAFGDAF